MVETLVVTEGVSLLKKYAVPVIGGAILLGLGFGAAEFWEHGGPRPKLFGWSILGQSLKTQLVIETASVPAQIAAATKAGMSMQSLADAPYFTSWAARVAADDAALKQARDDAATAQGKLDVFTTTQSATAFRLGAATCEKTNATLPASAAGPAAAGVPNDPATDFADLFKPGAFTTAP